VPEFSPACNPKAVALTGQRSPLRTPSRPVTAIRPMDWPLAHSNRTPIKPEQQYEKFRHLVQPGTVVPLSAVGCAATGSTDARVKRVVTDFSGPALLSVKQPFEPVPGT
jgi:hypothetical protein